MFEEIRQQLLTIEEMLKSSKGYDQVYGFSLHIQSADIYLAFTAKDTFQENVANDHKVGQFIYSGIFADSLPELWTKLYALPGREQRELEVLARQLTGITGMESQLRNVRAQMFLGPIIAQRDELTKYLAAPTVA